MKSNLTSSKSTTNRSAAGATKESPLLDLPTDLQVNILTYLRSYDLSNVQATCRFYARPELIDAVVSHFAESIYPSKWTLGFEESSQPPPNGGKAPPKKANAQMAQLRTFAQLRNMELLVVARALNSPEPASGFFVSKSWCKTALRWLDAQHESSLQQQQRNNNNKKLSKKKQRLRDRKISDASPPWPDANIDILCEHQNLQCCSNGKSARARRRLLDRQAWKILKRLYPDSTQLESALGECLQCTLEAETAKKNAADRLEQEKQARMQPFLGNEEVRRVFLRRSGVPAHAIVSTASLGQCPLQHGNYYVLPRSWCYAWRRYVKTGEGGGCSPPDASSLLCHAHSLALLPPHLEAYLYGDSPELLMPMGDHKSGGVLVPVVPLEAAHIENPLPVAAAAAAAGASQGNIPGQGPDPETLEALRAAGMGSPAQVGQQLSMMRELEDLQRAAPAAAAGSPSTTTAASKNEQLDCENYAVVEILTEKEYQALEGCWPWSGRGFGLRFGVNAQGVTFHTTQTCRECDATGRHSTLQIKNRNRKALRKSVDKARASLEY